jgi:predicted DNA-binding antitoxin AbrB/MazE fold protein
MIAYARTKMRKMTKSQTVEAVYENGILRPLKELVDLVEYSKVRIIVEYEENPSHPLLPFAGILSTDN